MSLIWTVCIENTQPNVILGIIMLSVIMLNVIMLIVIVPSVTMLSVIMLSATVHGIRLCYMIVTDIELTSDCLEGVFVWTRFKKTICL